MAIQIIIGTLASGKTTNLIRQAHTTGFTIVCNTSKRCRAVMEQANFLQIAIREPIPFQDFLDRRWYGLGCMGFLFDDIDMILQGLSPLPIGAVTLTDSGNVHRLAIKDNPMVPRRRRGDFYSDI